MGGSTTRNQKNVVRKNVVRRDPDAVTTGTQIPVLLELANFLQQQTYSHSNRGSSRFSFSISLKKQKESLRIINNCQITTS